MKKIYLIFLLLFLVISCTKSSEIQMPKYEAKLYLSNKVDLQTATKNKVTLLVIWSIFCGPCLKELPELQALYDHYKINRDISIVTIALNTEEELTQFSASNTKENNLYHKAFEHSGLKHFSLPVLIASTSPYQIENGNAKISDTSTANRLKKTFDFRAIPTTRIYDRQGKLVFEQLGVETSETGLRTHRLNLSRKLDSLVAM